MRLKSFSFLILGAALVGCAPKNPVYDKPILVLCGIDVSSKVGNCGKTGQGTATATEKIPLEKMDKFFAMSPKDWALVQNQMDKMAIYIQYLEKKLKDS